MPNESSNQSSNQILGQDEVICRLEAPLGRLTLNRPGALHSLNYNMCALMIDALMAWRSDDTVKAIWIDHQPETRGFCAGGDIRMLSESGQSDGTEACAFFRLEYQLNHLLKTYPKPVFAVMDGVTMGGGVGISVHGAFRIATENTVFAMPETGIALMPDVGGGWFLPRLDGELGAWLAMTGNRLKSADSFAAGIATHYVTTDQLDSVRAHIAEGLAADKNPADLLDEKHQDPGAPVQLDSETRAKIDTCFAFNRAEEIVAKLEDEKSKREGASPDASSDDLWEAKQLATLATKSPQSVKVALKQIRLGGAMADFADNMAMEYAVVSRIVMDPEFHEGVRAVILDKDNAPKWRYASIADVPDADIDAVFEPLPADKAWVPIEIMGTN